MVPVALVINFTIPFYQWLTHSGGDFFDLVSWLGFLEHHQLELVYQ